MGWTTALWLNRTEQNKTKQKHLCVSGEPTMTAGANHSNSNGCFSNHKLKMMKGWIVHLAIKSHDKNSPEKQSEQGKQRLMKSKEQVQIEESVGSGHSWERGMHACQPHVSAKIMKSHGVTWCFFKHCIACALAPSST